MPPAMRRASHWYTCSARNGRGSSPARSWASSARLAPTRLRAGRGPVRFGHWRFPRNAGTRRPARSIVARRRGGWRTRPSASRGRRRARPAPAARVRGAPGWRRPPAAARPCRACPAASRRTRTAARSRPGSDPRVFTTGRTSRARASISPSPAVPCVAVEIVHASLAAARCDPGVRNRARRRRLAAAFLPRRSRGRDDADRGAVPAGARGASRA